ncbi:unnamed protein product [Xylocopa violacea]|uniref:Chitin-binding type-2 domain-containing protein n=1 Tax=Xylocopa violacea TaxID=135666 RepID=A0ABP1PBI4_XYLVO
MCCETTSAGGLFLLLISVAAITANVIQPLEDRQCERNPKCSRPTNNSSPVIHIPYEPDCHKFYKCAYGEACLWDCPTYDGSNRLVFNPEEQVCDWPWNVPELPNCSNGDASNDTETASSTTSSTSTTTENNGIIGGIVMRHPRDTVNQYVQCPKNSDVRISHETNCNYYYECHNGNPTLMKCLAGLVFNPYLEICDYPSNYECQSSD